MVVQPVFVIAEEVGLEGGFESRSVRSQNEELASPHSSEYQVL